MAVTGVEGNGSGWLALLWALSRRLLALIYIVGTGHGVLGYQGPYDDTVGEQVRVFMQKNVLYCWIWR